jgi:hypothetical protein
MQALPQKTTDYIAEQFRAYYDRKAERPHLNLREAKTIIDFVGSPAPLGGGSSAMDLTKPVVTGGGPRKPSSERVESILQRFEVDEADALWNEVFDELIEQYKERNNKKALKLIRLTFEQRPTLKREEICEKMRISEKTFRAYRVAILTAAAICAIRKGGTLDT